MQYCRVNGEVWGSKVHPAIEGYKIVRVSPYVTGDSGILVSSTEILALDMLDARTGDTVLISSSSGVRNIVLSDSVPIKTITVAIVDEAEVSCSSEK